MKPFELSTSALQLRALHGKALQRRRRRRREPRAQAARIRNGAARSCDLLSLAGGGGGGGGAGLIARYKCGAQCEMHRGGDDPLGEVHQLGLHTLGQLLELLGCRQAEDARCLVRSLSRGGQAT
jgi:hypothetical protein